MGRSVVVPGDRWDIDGYHKGVIVSCGKYYPPRSRKQQFGYEVRMIEDDVREWWSPAELEPFLVDVGALTAVENMEEVPQVGGYIVTFHIFVSHTSRHINLYRLEIVFTRRDKDPMNGITVVLRPW